MKGTMIPFQIITNQKDIAVIVAHPDDETLWCGGTMLLLIPNAIGLSLVYAEKTILTEPQNLEEY